MDKCLTKMLLTICKESGSLKVNLPFTIPLLIREAECLLKLELPVPMIALTLFSKQDHFFTLKDSLQVKNVSLNK